MKILNNKFDFLIQEMKPYKYKIIFGCAVSTITSIIMLLEPILAKTLIDVCIVNKQINKIGILILTYIIIFLFGKLFDCFKNYYFFNISEDILLRLRQNVVKVSLNKVDLDKESKEYIMSHITSELPQLIQGIIVIFDKTVFQTITIIFIGCYLASISLSLIVIISIIFIVIFFVLKHFMPQMKNANMEILKSKSSTLNRIEENLNNVKLINYLNVFEYSEQKLKNCFKVEKSMRLKKFKLNVKMSIWLSILYFLPSIIIIFVGAWLIHQNSITIGTLYIMSSYTSKIFSPINFFSQLSMELQSMVLITERYNKIIKEAAFNYKLGLVNINKLKKNIQVKEVDFSYGKNNVFSNLNLNIDVNNKVLIKGKNGIGKTTLIELLLGINQIQSGDILFDSISCKNINKQSISNIISVVPQQHYFFTGTIMDNLILGRDIKKSKIEEIIGELDIGNNFDDNFNLDTMVEKNGENLSGGQKQILSIIRALAWDTDLIILDEPFNHLDESIKRKLEIFIEKVNNKTIILIAHQYNNNNFYEINF